MIFKYRIGFIIKMAESGVTVATKATGKSYRVHWEQETCIHLDFTATLLRPMYCDSVDPTPVPKDGIQPVAMLLRQSLEPLLKVICLCTIHHTIHGCALYSVVIHLLSVFAMGITVLSQVSRSL